MPLKHLNITISGRVQGVWFRKHTETKAIELGVHGFVANKENGNVYVEVEGFGYLCCMVLYWFSFLIRKKCKM